jgi:hypothetical protein
LLTTSAALDERLATMSESKHETAGRAVFPVTVKSAAATRIVVARLTRLAAHAIRPASNITLT